VTNERFQFWFAVIPPAIMTGGSACFAYAGNWNLSFWVLAVETVIILVDCKVNLMRLK